MPATVIRLRCSGFHSLGHHNSTGDGGGVYKANTRWRIRCKSLLV